MENSLFLGVPILKHITVDTQLGGGKNEYSRVAAAESIWVLW